MSVIKRKSHDYNITASAVQEFKHKTLQLRHTMMPPKIG